MTDVREKAGPRAGTPPTVATLVSLGNGRVGRLQLSWRQSFQLGEAVSERATAMGLVADGHAELVGRLPDWWDRQPLRMYATKGCLHFETGKLVRPGEIFVCDAYSSTRRNAMFERYCLTGAAYPVVEPDWWTAKKRGWTVHQWAEPAKERGGRVR